MSDPITGAGLEDWQKARLAYTDAELYRLIVARHLVDGAAGCKEGVDSMVRGLGDLDEADKVIAFRDQRPGCVATDYSGRYDCPCGVSWEIGDPNPPACRKEALR
jgi:hypothetical protein